MALERRDIDAAAGTITVRHGKGDRRRVVGLDAGAFALLERWLDERRRRDLRARAIFCTLDGRSLQASYVRALLPRLARKAGIEKRVHPHGLRHSCAAELAIEVCRSHSSNSSSAMPACTRRPCICAISRRSS